MMSHQRTKILKAPWSASTAEKPLTYGPLVETSSSVSLVLSQPDPLGQFSINICDSTAWPPRRVYYHYSVSSFIKDGTLVNKQVHTHAIHGGWDLNVKPTWGRLPFSPHVEFTVRITVVRGKGFELVVDGVGIGLVPLDIPIGPFYVTVPHMDDVYGTNNIVVHSIAGSSERPMGLARLDIKRKVDSNTIHVLDVEDMEELRAYLLEHYQIESKDDVPRIKIQGRDAWIRFQFAINAVKAEKYLGDVYKLKRSTVSEGFWDT